MSNNWTKVQAPNNKTGMGLQSHEKLRESWTKVQAPSLNGDGTSVP